jgi:hypothetical protein
MSDHYAVKIKNINDSQILWSVFPRISGHKWIVTSAKNLPFTGPETYMFGADENGNIVDWSELEGSCRGTLEHKVCFQNIGYNIDE